MSYKDRTFCGADDCAKRNKCDRRLTKIDKEVIKRKGYRVLIIDKFDCYKKESK